MSPSAGTQGRLDWGGGLEIRGGSCPFGKKKSEGHADQVTENYAAATIRPSANFEKDAGN